jgi:type IV secretory pathway TrbL component
VIPLSLTHTLKLIAGIGAALLLALLIHDRNRWKATAELRRSQLVAEQQAHAATVSNYRAAAERARREDAENFARITAEQSKISERTAHDFESRIAAAHADAERLRRSTQTAADSSRGGGAPVPGFPSSAGAAAKAAGQDRLPQSDRLIATEQAIQLDELIKWLGRQYAVPQSGAAKDN